MLLCRSALRTAVAWIRAVSVSYILQLEKGRLRVLGADMGNSEMVA